MIREDYEMVVVVLIVDYSALFYSERKAKSADAVRNLVIGDHCQYV